MNKKIQSILNSGASSSINKRNEIVDDTISTLQQEGKFLKNNSTLYYFCNSKRKLFTVDTKSRDFKYHICDVTGLNKIDWLYKYIYSAIETYIYMYWESVDIKNFSHYSKEKNTLYIYNNCWEIIKITTSNITKINNGEEGIIFLSTDVRDKWEFIEQVDNIDYIDSLIESINFSPNDIWTEATSLMIKHYIYALFFPDIVQTRPILIFLWEKWSWKSYFFEVLLKIFFWKWRTTSGMPKNDADFKAMLINEYLVFYDNVDEKIWDSKIDILCNTSTWWSIKLRKLYSDGEQLEYKLNCFVWINSRSWAFGRDDLADRSIFFNLQRRDKFNSSYISQEKYIKNRDMIISSLCFKLQDILKELSEYINYDTSFRISDFSNFVLNCNKSNKKNISTMFEKLQDKQMEFTNNSDPLLNLIESILSSKHWEIEQWFYYSSSELHNIFASYAKINRHIVSYGHKSPKSLGKSLNINRESYSKVGNIKIDIHKEGWNKQKYSLNFITN